MFFCLSVPMIDKVNLHLHFLPDGFFFFLLLCSFGHM